MQFLEECFQLELPLSRLSERAKIEVASILEDAALFDNQGVFSSLVNRLRVLSSNEDVSPGKLADLVVADPFLCLRLIHLSSSSVFAQGQGQGNFSLDAVIQKFGIRRVADIITEFSENKALEPELETNSTALLAYQEFILSVILTRTIFRGISEGAEEERLAVMCTALRLLPGLILSISAPHLSAAVSMEPLVDDQTFYEKNFRQLIGMTPSELGAKILGRLNLPEVLLNMASRLDIAPWNRRFSEGVGFERYRKPLQASYCAVKISREILSFHESHFLTNILRDFESRLGVPRQVFLQALSGVSNTFRFECDQLGILPLPLPAFLQKYTDQIVETDGSITSESVEWPSSAKRAAPFMSELKECFANPPEENSSPFLRRAISCTLNTLVRSLDFDRAVFYRLDKSDECAKAVFLLGRLPKDEHLEGYSLSFEGDLNYRPDYQCVRKETAIFQGDPIFGDDWPLLAFPVIWNGKVRGFFYADRRHSKDAEPLSLDEQMIAVALSEQWRQVPFEFY